VLEYGGVHVGPGLGGRGGRFGVGLGGGLALVVVGDGGGEDGVGVDRAVDEEGAVVDFQRQQRQQRRRRQEQVTRLLRPEVGLRREWVSTPPRAGGAGDLHGDQPHADPDVPALPVLVLHVVQELGGVVPVEDVAALRRLERVRR